MAREILLHSLNQIARCSKIDRAMEIKCRLSDKTMEMKIMRITRTIGAYRLLDWSENWTRVRRPG